MAALLDLVNRDASLRDDDDEEYRNVVTAKATAMAVLFAASMTIGAIPLLLSKKLAFFNIKDGSEIKSNRIIVALLAFGGGVLLSTTFMHLLPEVDHNIEYLQSYGALPELDFSLAPLLMCCGFFIMYLVEELVHTYLNHRTSQNIKNSNLVRTLSIRGSQAAKGDASVTSTAELIHDAESPSEKKTLPSAPPQPVNGHSHSHGHGHSHLPSAALGEDQVTSTLRGLLIVLALSVHELFEGLAVGLESSASHVWYLLGAIAAHKLVLAFCIGVELIASRTRLWLALLYVFTFAVVSPMGIGIGLALVGGGGATSAGLVSVVLQGIATGTLLYVVFFEILGGSKGGFIQFTAALIGFGFMFGLQVLTGHSHSHSHSHGGDDDSDHGHSHDR